MLFPKNSTSSFDTTVYLKISGPGSSDYSSRDKVKVRVLSDSAPPPAPVLLAAKFDNVLFTLTITFSAATNKAVSVISPVANDWRCDVLFSFPGNDQARCKWLDSDSVEVTLGRTAVLVPGDTVTLLADKITADCSPNTCTKQSLQSKASSVTLQPPGVSVFPVPMLNAPSVLSSCDNLTIDATTSTGFAGRPWTSVVYNVSTPGNLGITSELRDLLKSKTSTDSVLSIPSRALPLFQKYTVSLVLKNFLGQSASKSVVVTKSDDSNQPSALIYGPSFVSLNVSQSLSLEGVGKASSCASSTQLTYFWSISLTGTSSAQPVVFSSTDRDPRKLTLPPYTLQAMSQYKVLLTVASGSGSKSVASTIVYVNSDVVTAVIAGGSYRSIPTDGTFSLDASGSLDMNIDPKKSSSASLDFMWTCTIASGSSYGSNCPDSSIKSAKGPIVQLKGSTLTVMTSYTYTVLVKSSDGRLASASVTVVAIGPNAPQVTIAVPASIKFNPTNILSLSGVVVSGVSCRTSWAVLSWSDAMLRNVSMTPLTQTLSLASTGSVNASLFLGVAANAFSPGVTYTFRLSATSTSSSTASGAASV